jgi:hypothetical protein
MMLCPHRRNADGLPCQPTEPEIKSIAGCPVKTKEIRERLSSISWWMRLLCQRIAMRANREENEVGRFWQDRYRATVLTDDASLLACAAYVDLNPIRAAMCEKLGESATRRCSGGSKPTEKRLQTKRILGHAIHSWRR